MRTSARHTALIGRTVPFVRCPSLDVDFWELESAESRHAEAPDSFWIPPRRDREQLRKGHAAKLLFAIEGASEDGSVAVQVERMWVVVTEVLADGFLGVLVNAPASIDDSRGFYLSNGAEVPFRAEHVADIDEPPANAVIPEPLRRWHSD